MMEAGEARHALARPIAFHHAADHHGTILVRGCQR